MSRPRCARCLRPSSHCLCSLIPHLPNRTALLLLQHPDEVKHGLNTGRFVAQGLRHAQLKVGEVFTDLDFSAWDAWLLFPGATASTLSEVTAQPTTRPRLLVVLDGTWRKARKLLYLNPPLADLPRVTLPAGLVSNYRLRKAPTAGALSTVEAVVHALNVLDAPQKHDALLRPFEALIEGQIQAMGEERFRRNYPPKA